MANQNAIEQFFKDADADGSGYITVQELSTLLQSKGYKVDEDQVQAMFNSIDVEGDQKISYDEYLAGMGQRPSTDHKAAHMRRVFREFDKSGDGRIDHAELTSVMREMRSDFTDQEIQDIIALADKDGSGCLNYEEFIEQVFGKQ